MTWYMLNQFDMKLTKSYANRYKKCSKKAKTVLLSEYCIIEGIERKTAIKRLSRVWILPRPPKSVSPKSHGGRKTTYLPFHKTAVHEAWQLSGHICGERLQPMIGEYLQALQMAHRISLSPYDLELLSQISVISLKRMISTFEEKIYDKMHNPKRRTGTPALYKMIPISAKFGKRSHEKPGLIEVDYVEHKGGVNSGRFAITGTYTDIVCGWIVRAAGWGHNLCSIQSIHDTLSPRIYHRPREYHPDNAPALLRCLFDMVQSTQIDRKRMTLKLSRSRPYESNDNAHVEQKNGDKVRNLVGHKRYDQEEQVDMVYPSS
jgi:hypothetical protein